MDFEHIFELNKEKTIEGRYLSLELVSPLLLRLNTNGELSVLGKSVLEASIYQYKIGEGPIRVLLWSQMHGNESTTTKALIDFLNLLKGNSELAKSLLSQFTFCTIPILNPDGAKLYTRENANKVDLNRDSKDLTQPESQILRAVFEKFKPHYCYNLHDQRTVFGVGDTAKVATVSFLAPSYNEAREINETRQKAMFLIGNINEILQKYIPGQVGRFDDSFNINCVGDTFQYLGVPTLLFEAGHFAEDYGREETRKYIFISLLSSFILINENDIVDNKKDKYLNIPQNKPNFYDFIYKNIKINYDGIEKITNFAIQYKEELVENTIQFNAYIVHIGDLDGYYGHFEYDAKEALYKNESNSIPEINQIANFYLGQDLRITNGRIEL